MSDQGQRESRTEFDLRRYVLTAISLHWHYRRSAPPAGLALAGSPRTDGNMSWSWLTRNPAALNADRRRTAG
jgi:hypothetical protein